MSKTYEEWLEYYENYKKEQVIFDLWLNMQEIERLNSKAEELMTLYTTEREVKEDYKSIIKEVKEYIKENEKEYGSLEDNEKIILDILKGE